MSGTYLNLIMILMLWCVICTYECVYMCSLCLYILLCNRAPWKNSVTEWLPCINIFEMKIKIKNYCSTHLIQPSTRSCTSVFTFPALFINSGSFQMELKLCVLKHNLDIRFSGKASSGTAIPFSHMQSTGNSVIQIPKLKCFSSRLVVVFALYIEAWC